MADICLVSGMTGAAFFQVDTAPYPTAKRITEACMEMEPFANAHPLKQSGAPASVGH
jgi:maleylacetoacetate isomerase